MSPEHKEFDLSKLLDQGLRDLIDLVSQGKVTELEIEQGGFRLRLRNDVNIPHQVQPIPHAQVETYPVQTPPPQQVTQPTQAPATTEQTESQHIVPITAPMVGTFYTSPSPDADPYVKVGDFIRPGQTIGIIEAMKIMNDVPAEIGGRVVEIVAQNGQAVEYGQPLMLVDTSATPE